MKVTMMLGLITLAVGLSTPIVASSPAATPPPNQPTTDRAHNIIAVIDGIPVPLEVHMAIQLKYQGHAVTEAKLVDHNGEKAYRLRVDRDDIPDDYNSIYLYYDMKWQLLDDKKITPPPKPLYVPEPPKPAPRPQPAPAPAPPAPQATPEPTPQKPQAEVGGRGGNDTDKPEATKPDKEEGVTEENSEVEEKPQNTKPADESQSTNEEEAVSTDKKDEA